VLANTAAKYFNYGKRRGELYQMSVVFNAPTGHPHVNLNGTRVDAALRVATQVIKKELAMSKLLPASIKIGEDDWRLMAELEGIGKALSRYVTIVQFEKCYTGSMRLATYFDLKKTFNREGPGVLQFVRPVTRDPPPQRKRVKYNELTAAGKKSWERTEDEMERRIHKTPIQIDEVAAVLGDIRLAKDQKRYLEDGIELKLVPQATLDNVMDAFKSHYAAVEDFKTTISPQNPMPVEVPLQCATISGSSFV